MTQHLAFDFARPGPVAVGTLATGAACTWGPFAYTVAGRDGGEVTT